MSAPELSAPQPSLWQRSKDWYRSHRGLIVLCLVVLIAILGTWGIRIAAPEKPWDWTAYHVLRLFTLNTPPVPDEANVPWQLNLARFLAAAVLFYGVALVAYRMVSARRVMSKAIRFQDHIVILGHSEEVVPAALNLKVRTGQKGRRGGKWLRRVVVIGQLSEHERLELASAKIAHLSAVPDTYLQKILAGAERIVVMDLDDEYTTELAQKARHFADEKTPMFVLFNDRKVAEQWRNETGDLALCRSSLVAMMLLRQQPPYAEDAVSPPPIVVGDSPVAGAILRRIAVGWQQPAEQRHVQVASRDEEWIEPAIIGVEDKVQVTWRRMNPYVEVCAETVRGIVDSWVRDHKERYATASPTIYVAYRSSVHSSPIAKKLAKKLPEATVVAVVRDRETWEIPGAETDQLTLVSPREILSSADTILLHPHDLLAKEISADQARWPADMPGLFESLREPGARPDEVAAVQAVAEQIKEILGAAGVRLAYDDNDDDAVTILAPDQLRAVAGALRQTLDQVDGYDLTRAGDEQEQFHRLVELASRLPVLVSRCGWSPVSARSAEQRRFTQNLKHLAQQAHAQYVQTAQKTANATESANAERAWEELDSYAQRSNIAQMANIPVKLAIAGLSWRVSDHPAIAEFTDEQVEQLAELEHRRWFHFELRNGRTDHKHQREWDELTDGQKEYDREPVRRFPVLLAEIGLEITPATLS
ncbi:hypothetical protein [Nesterenkonia alba]|uniref:hypothetical protein n=1 Tax=Nesterenkonia alba TaxID=515814 RepID=UPI0003B753FC|nr:hypothetical protein [Nesterenkonia alba]